MTHHIALFRSDEPELGIYPHDVKAFSWSDELLYNRVSLTVTTLDGDESTFVAGHGCSLEDLQAFAQSVRDYWSSRT